MKKQTLYTITFLFAITLQAQVSKSNFSNLDLLQVPKEETQISINTNIILVGEYLYYKMYVFSNEKFSNISKVGYVELVDTNNNTIVKHILNLKNSTASNRIFIPTQLKTGQYKLLAYTNWTKNNPKKSYYSKDIYIINAFSNETQNIKKNINTIKIEKTNKLNTKRSKNNNLIVNTNKQQYNNRELVTINVNVTNNYINGNYKLSVNKIDSIIVNNNLENNFIAQKDSNTLFIPEMRGQLVIGKITNFKNPSDLNKKNVALSITGKEFIFKIAETNAFGDFFFNLDTKVNNENATFQVIESDKENFKIEINNHDKSNFKNISFNNIELDTTLIQNIKQRNIKNQIENAYYQHTNDSVLINFKTKLFYNSQEKIYNLDEYTRFKTVRETFIEVLNEAGLRKEGNNYRIIVYDYYDEKKSQAITDIDPLVMVDGMLVQNNNDLVNFNPYKIESISVVVGQYLYGSKLYQGIISVSTFNKDFKSSTSGDFIIETKLNLPEEEAIYYQPKYLNNIENKHIPDYRRQLLWLPNITLKQEKNSFNTYTSDDTGTYEVTVEGYNALGDYITSTNYFTVK